MQWVQKEKIGAPFFKGIGQVWCGMGFIWDVSKIWVQVTRKWTGTEQGGQEGVSVKVAFEALSWADKGIEEQTRVPGTLSVYEMG